MTRAFRVANLGLDRSSLRWQRATPIALATVLLLTVPASAQDCGEMPPIEREVASWLTVGFDSSTSTRQGPMQTAVQAWDFSMGVNAEGSMSVSLYGGTTTPGNGNIVVRVGSTPLGTDGQPANAAAAGELTQDGKVNGGTITLNEDTYHLWSDQFLTWVIMHEVGHHLGFGHVSSECNRGNAIMADPSPYVTWANTCKTHYEFIDSNSDESAAVEEHFNDYCDNPTECSPIIVDLDRNGRIEMSGPEVFFDLSGNGAAVVTGWTALGSGDGFLFLDRNGNGAVDDGRELFGNATPYSWSLESLVTSPHGFHALSLFDRLEQGGNGDHWISASDAVFSQLRFWVDRDHDGLSQPGELLTFEESGVTAIWLDYRISRRRDGFGNEFRYLGSAISNENGKVRWLAVIDVFPVIKQ
jgi:hypothetical protein